MREEWLDCNGMELCICSWGDPGGKPVVILHGLKDQGAAWGPVARILAREGYHVIAPDQRGHGRSAHVPALTHYHFPDYVADLACLLERKCVEPALLVGHSMGGTVASIHAALSRPVGPLVLVEGLGPIHEDPKAQVQRYRTHLVQRTERRQHKPVPTKADAAKRIAQSCPAIQEGLAEVLAERGTRREGDGWIWSWDPRHRDRSAVGFHLGRHLEILSRIETPTSLVFGERSPYRNLPDLGKRIGSIGSLKSTHLLPSGHSPHYECPDLLADLLLQALGQGVHTVL
jgi:pimeloyl-ACP methyl ester carboxylesterase